MDADNESVVVGREHCPKCGSTDNLARYSDGHAYCFGAGCGHYEPGEGQDDDRPRPKRTRMKDFVDGEVSALRKRKINEETCRKFNYTVGEYKGQTVQIANYYDPEGKGVVAQKVRFPNKDFTVTGNMKEAGLYGQHLWRDQGKMVVVVEGEVDCLTVSQLQNNKWPVVSIPNGAQGAKKALSKALDWLLGFETIVLFFDNDEPGKVAADECAPLFPPGRVKIARMTEYKDPSDALQGGEGGKVIDAIWGAKAYRPDGIVNGTDLWDELTTDDENVQCIPYPWEKANEKTMGLRKGELVTFTAGSGVGKSAVVREIAYHLLREGETVGMLMLEENTKRTAKGLMGIHLNKPLHLDMTAWADLSEEEKAARREAYDVTVGSGRLFLYDHFGSTDIENLMARVRFLAKGCECGWIILDHLSIVVSGLDDGDERKTIDRVMTMLRTLVEETGVGLLMVSHLKRPEGNRGHEQGAMTSLSQLRGSHAIAQLSDMVIGVERDQQGEMPDLSLIRVLKNRFCGQTGPACFLKYDKETGRLIECDPAFEGSRSEGDDDDDDCPF